MKQDRFIKVIKSMIKKSGGSVDRVNLGKFIELMNDSFIFPWNQWLGVKILKSPLGLMTLQEIVFEKRPDTIIECGTCFGGSSYYMAGLMDLMHIDGKIITIDRENFPIISHTEKGLMNLGGKVVSVDYKLYQPLPVHPKIKYLHSDCLTAEIPKLGVRTMVILDCNHSMMHVCSELDKYSSMVTPGQYIIVEDTVVSDKNNGPAGAIKKFLRKTSILSSTKPEKNSE